MSANSPIQWTDDTWNAIVGCSIVSPGCTNCYAMHMAARIEAMNAGVKPPMRPVTHYDGTTKKVNGNAVWTGKVALAPDDAFTRPLRWKKPRKIFVNSMSDLFHEDIPDEWIDRVFAIMALCPQHTFQVLTKRAGRMRDYAAKRNGIGNAAICDAINDIPYPLGNRRGALEMPLPNVWLGVSTERQQEADERVPHLLQTPAAVRFISAEPLLGPINLQFYIHSIHNAPEAALDWVIVGGESGPGARAMHLEWTTSLVDQCGAARVPCFVKQLGALPLSDEGLLKLSDRKGGDPEEWPKHLRIRQMPAAAIAEAA